MGDFDADIEDMLGDVNNALGRTISITKSVRGSFNTSTMTRATTDTSTSVKAVRQPSRTSLSVGNQSLEEFQYEVRKTELSFDPDRNDLIEDTQGQNTLILQITNVENAANGLAWILTAKVKRSEP